MSAKKKTPSNQPPLELDDSASAALGGDVIEFDPNAPPAANEGDIAEAEATADTFVPEEGLLSARDELQAILGGGEAMMAAALEAAEPGSLGPQNIQGVGVGFKTVSGQHTGDLVVKVYVMEKAPAAQVHADFFIPASVNGYATDVEAVGEITAFVYKARYPRPVPCGVSCGHLKVTAGTIGCLVVLNNGRLCILSNNHVLANQNNARVGDPIIQPGAYDGGRMPGDRIALLERFVPINFSGANVVDAAAAFTARTLVKPQHVTYRMNPKPLAASLGLTVAKNGRTTQSTLGVITGVGVNGVRVGYSGGRIAVFNNQIIIQGIGGKQFSAGGDSGSVIVSARSCQPVGLLFAGSNTHTIANLIGNVISQLGIRNLVGG
jgi:hypothetical protein